MGRSIQVLEISAEQRRELRRVINRPSSPQRDVRRAWIILHRADGLSQQATAERVQVRRTVVGHWEQRFREKGVAGLADAPGRGRKPRLTAEQKQFVITHATRPPEGRARWTVRSMARQTGLAVGSVHALWQANEIKPHLVRTFKLSHDPAFEAKFWDVIGLYLQPPDKALVLCCDEKSQCQALERSQPGLPLGVGHVRTRTHDYTRHGTITLFSALNYLEGTVLSRTAERHTHREWLAFLKQLDRDCPAELTLHLIIDNYATHKHPAVQSWLATRNRRAQRTHARERFVLHFTPTSSSWLNLVERFFRDLSQDVVLPGSFESVPALVRAINTYLAARNRAPKPYRWKAKGEDILAKLQRARTAAAANTAKA